MSDEIKKTDADDSVDTEEKAEAVKKPAVSKKKVKAKEKEKEKVTDDSESDGNKKKIIDKLQAMGVMSGKKTAAAGNHKSESGEFLKVTIAVVVAIGLVGSFVWALNKEAANESIASGTHEHATPSAYPASYNNTRYNPTNYNNQQQRVVQQQEQQKKWMQQQQQAQEQQRAQQQKWAQQWQQAQEQQRAQQQKWAQQRPTQEQYRTQQQKWAQQRQQAQEQQRAQQQKWAQQWQQAQEQRRAQQQKWAQQQPNNTYRPRTDYQGQPIPSGYNNAPRYQQPRPYYGPQY